MATRKAHARSEGSITEANKPLGRNPGAQDMGKTEKSFETIPAGTAVTWHYRSAIGHGTVIGVHRMGTTADNTMYSVRQHDHHPGEPDILHHSGKALSRVQS